VLADPAALITGRNHHSAGFGVIRSYRQASRYDSVITPDNATWYNPQRQRLRHVVVRQEPQHAGVPIHRRRPFNQWPVGMGFDYFYGFMGARQTSGRLIFPEQQQIFPWIGKPGYNLTTDLADEAIGYMKELNSARPTKPFFLYYVPGGATRRPAEAEWSKSSRAKFDMAGTRCASRFCQPEARRCDSRQCKLTTGPIAYRSGRRFQPIRRSCSPEHEVYAATRPTPITKSLV